MNGYTGGALFMTVGAVVFLVVLGRGALAHRRMSRSAVRVPGVVLELRTARIAGETRTQYAPVLEFRTVDGDLVRAESSVTSNPPVAEPGQTVRVAYHPDDPRNAYVDTVGGSGVLIYALGLVVVSIVFVISAAVLISSLV